MYKNQMYKNQIISIVIIVVLVLILGVIVPSFMPTQEKDKSKIEKDHAYFVISAWNYPSGDYGQGLIQYAIYENITYGGAWTYIWYNDRTMQYYNDSALYEWDIEHIGLKIKMYAIINSTLTDLSDLADGDNIQQLNISVITDDEIIFSENNLSIIYRSDTYPQTEYGLPDHLWMYGFETIINIAPESGKIYQVTFTYEVFY